MPGHDAIRRASGDMSVRAFLVPALVILIALAAWRGFGPSSVAGSGLPGASVEDARLTGLLERLVGAGRVDAVIRPAGAEAAGVLVLIDERASPAIADAEISSLIMATGLVEPRDAARIDIRRVAFAPAPGAGLSVAIEFAGFVLIAACLVGALAAARQTPSTPAAPSLRREPPRVHDTAPRTDDGRALALQAIRSDPARAASVLRAWIAGDGGRA